MNNITLRKIFTMLVEKLARLENFYNKNVESQDKVNVKFINTCQQSLKEIKQDLFAVYPLLIKTYESKPISQTETEKSLTVFKNCLDKFLELHSLSAHLPSNTIVSETYIFLSEVLKTKSSFKEFDSRIVLLTQDFLTRNTHKCCTNLPYISDMEKVPLALYLPVVQSSNPLYWPLLSKNAYSNVDGLIAKAKSYYDELIGKQVQMPEEKRKIVEKLAFQLTSDLFSLKLLGPAHYFLFTEMGVFRSIAETKIRYLPTLAIREQILFNELKNINLSNIIESIHERFKTISKLSNEMHSALGFKVDISDIKDNLNEFVNKIILEAENIIPEKNFFNCDDLCVSFVGFEKLKKGMLIASSTREELEKIKDSYNLTEYTDKITNIKEISNTPQQIINAGWIYNEFMGDDIMHKILQNKNLDYSPFIEHIKNLDNLLINSVEKSRINGMLLNED